MIIEQKKCDQCGKIHQLTKDTIEVRKVSGCTVPQIERDDAEVPSWELPDRRKVYTLASYDFCDLVCAKAWIDLKAVLPKDCTPSQ